MKRPRVLTLAIILVVLLVILAGAGAWFVRRPWPRTKGTIAVSGLSLDIGMPHPYFAMWGSCSTL